MSEADVAYKSSSNRSCQLLGRSVGMESQKSAVKDVKNQNQLCARNRECLSAFRLHHARRETLPKSEIEAHKFNIQLVLAISSC